MWKAKLVEPKVGSFVAIDTGFEIVRGGCIVEISDDGVAKILASGFGGPIYRKIVELTRVENYFLQPQWLTKIVW